MISCMYKQNNHCDFYKADVQEVEKQKSVKCCDNCHAQIKVYSDIDKINLLQEAYNQAKKEITVDEVIYMRALYGHNASTKDDYDDIYYNGYTIWLLVHKKYKYIHDFELITAYECMKLLRMKISKSIIRKVRRKLRPNKKHLV